MTVCMTCHPHTKNVHHLPSGCVHSVTSALSALDVTMNNFLHTFSQLLIRVTLFLISLELWGFSITGSPNPPSDRSCSRCGLVVVTVGLICSDSLAVGGQITQHCGGALYLQHRRETWASDQTVDNMGPRPLLV
ncbi:hypothetical protein AMECASPLE_019253 [Ameca splendens]|uniref:Uncharacterized protein n=1 Tax=Ameca splendens TaxID=208324 RepID=A0ABV0XG12_9TELE